MDFNDWVMMDIMDDLVRPQGRYPEIFMMISLLEVCQEVGIKNGSPLRTLQFPDQRLGRLGYY